MQNYHFWYSAKQERARSCCSERMPINFAIINGKEVLYTTCSSSMAHGCAFDDMIYLGQGDYSRSQGYW